MSVIIPSLHHFDIHYQHYRQDNDGVATLLQRRTVHLSCYIAERLLTSNLLTAIFN